MIRVNVVVEGQAEETFVRECLQPQLCGRMTITARRVEFSRQRRKVYRGGLVKYAKLRKDVIDWLNQEAQSRVTTMVDLYALPLDFPGWKLAAKIKDPLQRVAALEKAFAEDIGSSRFIPNIQLHEFEALLFSDIGRLVVGYPGFRKEIESLEEETAQINPELINDGQETAPSKRILQTIPKYDKVWAGGLTVLEIGLPQIRKCCRHFDAWLTVLERL